MLGQGGCEESAFRSSCPGPLLFTLFLDHSMLVHRSVPFSLFSLLSGMSFYACLLEKALASFTAISHITPASCRKPSLTHFVHLFILLLIYHSVSRTNSSARASLIAFKWIFLVALIRVLCNYLWAPQGQTLLSFVAPSLAQSLTQDCRSIRLAK